MPYILHLCRVAALVSGAMALALAQSDSLALSDSSTTAGGTAAVNLTITSPSGGEPAGLQWTVPYATSDVTAISMSAGPALTAAGKSLSCASSPGLYTCVATGLNSTVILNGTVAIVSVTLSSTITGTTLSLANTLGASPAGGSITTTASADVITTTGATPPGVSALACSPSSINAPGTSTCTVTLSGTAPSAGAIVSLTDNSASLSAPPSVTVAAGATTASFTATAGSITTNQSTSITASLNGSSQTATLTLVAAVLVSALQCSPVNIPSGSYSTCTVTLNQPASTAGTAVAISDNNTAVSVPASVTVAAAATSGTFTAQATAVSTNQNATITASLNGGSTSTSVTVLAPAMISSVGCSPASLTSATASTCTISLAAPAPTAAAVTLSSSTTALSVPAAVNIAAGGVSATFTATAGSLTADQTATITASLNGSSQTASILLVSPVVPSSLACTPTTLPSAAGSTCTVTLNKAAPSTGSQVVLASSSSLLNSPASVTVASGATIVTFTADAGIISSNSTAVLTASLNSVSQSVTFSLSAAPAITSLTCAQATLLVGSSMKCTAALVNIATRVNILLSTNAVGSLAIPPYLTTSAGAKKAAFSVTATAPYIGVVIVTTTLGESSQTAAFSIGGAVTSAAAVSRITCNTLSMVAGGSTQCSVQLTSPAPSGGARLEIVSTNPNVTAPRTVTVPEGASAASFLVRSRPSDRREQGEIIVTSDENGGAVTLDIAGVRPDSLSCSPVRVAAGGTTTCELRLNVPLDTSAALSLSSDVAGLKVPTVIRTRAHQSSATFQATADLAVRDQTVTVAAAFGANRVEAGIGVAAGMAPVLRVPGTQLVRIGSPVQFSVAASDPAGMPVQLSAGNLPAGASFDSDGGVFRWVPDTSQQGTYTVVFTAVGAYNATASRPVTIEVDDGVPSLSAVLHGAMHQPVAACSPSAVATAVGRWLSAGRSADPSGNRLELNGVKVKINGSYVPVLSIAPRAVNFLCPALPAGTPLQVSVETAHGATNAISITMADAAPGIFSLDDSGAGQGVVTIAGSALLAMPRNFAVDGEPAQPGDELAILTTGLPADPDLWHQLAVRIGDIYARVDSVEPVNGRAGVYSVQFQLPSAAPFGDCVPVRLELSQSDSVWTSDPVSIATEAVRP